MPTFSNETNRRINLNSRHLRRSKLVSNEFRDNILKADRVNSEFLRFEKNVKRDKNTFEDNKMRGARAKRGDLRKSEVSPLKISIHSQY